MDGADDSRDEPQLPAFDEAFVSGGIREPSAAEREAMARAPVDELAARRAARAARPRQRGQRSPRGLARQVKRWVPTLFVVGVLLTLAWGQRPRDGASYSAGGFLIAVDDTNRPTPRSSPSDVPLGVPSPSPTSSAYTFIDTQRDGVTPVAYDPCRELHVVINPRTVPSGAERVVHQALDEMSAITGLQFVVDGEVDESPESKRDPYQPDRYGDRWAPILVAWSDADELPDLAGDVAGIGGSAHVSVDGTKVYVSGLVGLDGPSFNEFMSYPNGSELARAVVLHELGHVLGLDHVDDPHQLMYEDNLGVIIPQAGDRAGLSLLGQGACVPKL